jgi:hypothetical protein
VQLTGCEHLLEAETEEAAAVIKMVAMMAEMAAAV